MLIQVDMLIWQPVSYIIFFFTFYPAFLPALGIEIIFTKQRHITYVISVVGNPDGQKYISIMFSNRTVIMINVFVIWWCQYYRSHATSGLFTQFNEAKTFFEAAFSLISDIVCFPQSGPAFQECTVNVPYLKVSS